MKRIKRELTIQIAQRNPKVLRGCIAHRKKWISKLSRIGTITSVEYCGKKKNSLREVLSVSFGRRTKICNSPVTQQQDEIPFYVAFNPKSQLPESSAILEPGIWKSDAIWTIDLFPQIPHTECIGRFI